jgi:hypothetical protein
MKKIIFISLLFILVKSINAQNVGVGTNTPTAKLHVNGTVRSSGVITADDDLVVSGVVGLGSIANPSYRLQVNGASRFIGNGTFTGSLNVDNSLTAFSVISETTLRVTDYAAIGGALDNMFKLRVYDGNTRLGGDAQVTGNMAIGGDLDNLYRLRVYDGNARIGGEFHATGNVGIGNTPDANYKLRVYGGNSRFDGNANITGNLDAGSIDIAGALTIGGKGSVRSNGSSPLRIGFDSKWINHNFGPGETATWTVNITAFSGGYDDVRIFVSQYQNEGGDNAFHFFGVSITNINASDDTCELKLKNLSSYTEQLTGTVHITTIAKN